MQKRIDIFTYGTLMFEPVISKLVTEKYQSKKATLKGYRRRKLTGQLYPGITPCSEDEVQGLLYLSINHKDTERLDEFEYEYTRDPVTVILEDNKSHECYAYVIKNPLRMSEQAWEPEVFGKAYAEVFASQHSSTIPN